MINKVHVDLYRILLLILLLSLLLSSNQCVRCTSNTRVKGPVLIGAGFNENR